MKESSTLQILCIHHQHHNIGTYEQMNQLTSTAKNLQILQTRIQIAPPTPFNVTINPSKKWDKLKYSNTTANSNMRTPQPPNYQTNLPLKFHPQFSYYTAGSLINPKEISPGVWRREKTGYGIYSLKGLISSKNYTVTKTYYAHKC